MGMQVKDLPPLEIDISSSNYPKADNESPSFRESPSICMDKDELNIMAILNSQSRKNKKEESMRNNHMKHFSEGNLKVADYAPEGVGSGLSFREQAQIYQVRIAKQ